MTPRGRVRHAFTVDVEDWFDGIPIGEGRKRSAERRLQAAMDLLLGMLDERAVAATFFWLGVTAVAYPSLVRRVAEAGHEVGSHGWSHDPIHAMTPARFRAETATTGALVADLAGRPVTAYRAAYFSITASTIWALEVLAELGYRVDSSIFPVHNWRYGIPGFDPHPRTVATPSGPIVELPISVRRLCGTNVPVSGGSYLRLYPYSVSLANFRALEREGRPGVFYLHPWELDPDHPRIPFDRRARVTHYANLRSTGRKLRRLIEDVRFGTVGQILSDLQLGATDRMGDHRGRADVAGGMEAAPATGSLDPA